MPVLSFTLTITTTATVTAAAIHSSFLVLLCAFLCFVKFCSRYVLLCGASLCYVLSTCAVFTITITTTAIHSFFFSRFVMCIFFMFCYVLFSLCFVMCLVLVLSSLLLSPPLLLPLPLSFIFICMF